MGSKMRKACAFILASMIGIQPILATNYSQIKECKTTEKTINRGEEKSKEGLVNGGFELTEATTDKKFWTDGTKAVGWEAKPFGAYSTARCQIVEGNNDNILKMEAYQGNTRTFLTQIIEVKPNTTYTIKAKIKTEAISGNDFGIQTMEKNSSGKIIDGTNTTHVKLTGTNDWKEYEISFTTHEEAVQLEFRLILGAGYRVNSGSAFIDNVVLEEQIKPGINLAKDKKVRASNEFSSGYTASMAVDGNKATRWATKGKENHWYEIDFEKEVAFDTIKIDEYVGSGEKTRLQDFSFQYWNGTDWVKFYDGTTGGAKPVYSFDTVTTSKLKIDMPMCAGDPTFYEVEVYLAHIDEIILDQTKIVGEVGDKYTFNPVILPEYASNVPLVWTSSNPEVATVNELGEVTFIKAGQTQITATTPKGDTSAVCEVEVVDQLVINNIELKSAVRLSKGEKIQLVPTLDPAGAVGVPLTWESSNPVAVTVDGEGNLSAVAEGVAEISVTTPNGVKATCQVTVNELVPSILPNGGFEDATGSMPDKMTINHLEGNASVAVDTAESYRGASSLKISSQQPAKVNIEPTNNKLPAKDSEIYRITAKVKGDGQAIGEAKFKYTHHKGGRTGLTTYSEPVTIGSEWTDITIVCDPMQSTSGQSAYLELEVEGGQVWVDEWRIEKLQRHNLLELPETLAIDISTGAVAQPVEITKDTGINKDDRLLWITSDESVLTVEDGVITPKKAGQATLSVMTRDRIVRDACEVTVTGEIPVDQIIGVEQILFKQTSVQLEVDRTIDLEPQVLPRNATEQTLVWHSSDEGIAKVVNGRIRGINEGTATITATAANGVVKQCEVTVVAEQIDEYEMMIDAWIAKSNHQVTDKLLERVQISWATMDKNLSREGLWYEPTVTVPRVWESNKINQDATKLREMAIAATMEGSPLKGNEVLIQDVVSATMWLYENCFSMNNFMGYTWWQWEIGIPQIVNDIFAMMYPYFTQEEINEVMGFIHNDLMPHPEYMEYMAGGRLPNSGANLSDQVMVALVPAIFLKDEARIERCKTLVLQSMDYVKSGDGFYEDGSFIQHGDIAYTGSYGAVYLGGLTIILDVLAGTEHQVSGEQAKRLYEIIEKTYLPLIYKGSTMEMVNGRSIVRNGSNDHRGNIHGTVVNALRLALSAPEPYKTTILETCKYMIQQDGICDYTKSSPYIEKVVTQLLSDDTIQAKAPIIHKEYGGMNRTVHHEEEFAVGISKSSNRIKNYEVTNYENQKGWHTGDGMMYLYNNDLKHYDDNYWVTVNWDRLPGVTADPQRERKWGAQSSGDAQGRPKNTWAGGVTFEGRYGTSGMNLQALDGKVATDLTANKSWFMFDDAVIAIGSAINNTDGRMIETTVEQRRINGDNPLTIDGALQSMELGWEQGLNNVSWAHLEGDNEGADIGYYFPGGADVKATRKAQEGTYHEISKNDNHEVHTSNFLTMWLEHGVNPVNETYAYAIVPGASAVEMEAYSQNPTFEIIKQTNEIHAVRHTKHDIIAANFYGKQTQEVEGIKVDGEAAVMLKDQEGVLSIAVSDPTMTRDQVIVELTGKTYTSEIVSNPNVQVEQLETGIRLTINTKDALSKSFEVKLGTKQEGARIELDVVESVTAGDRVQATLAVEGIEQPVYAKDLLVQYDQVLFEFAGVEELGDTIVVETIEKDGQVRIVLAIPNGVIQGADTLKLNFIAKSVNGDKTGNIGITDASIGVINEGAISETILAQGKVKSVLVKQKIVEVDKAILYSTIDTAQKLSDEAVMGSGIGHYPQVAKDALDSALLKAKQIASTSETQSEIDLAVQELEEAINTFKEAQIKGEKEDINKDGSINVADLALVAYYYKVNDQDSNWKEAEKANVDGDKEIGLGDLTIVANKILSK